MIFFRIRLLQPIYNESMEAGLLRINFLVIRICRPEMVKTLSGREV